ncbi:MAG: MOSC domain-containing protein [Myxococcota bacterium]
MTSAETSKLIEELGNQLHPGILRWIGLRPTKGAPMVAVPEVEAITDQGLVGDRSSAKVGRKRQVSIIQAEHLPVVASLCRVDEVMPAQCRRNLVVEGFSVASLRTARFAIGEVEFVGSGYCHPCGKMNRSVAPGGFQAMRGHGGIVARVTAGGVVRVGDPVRLLGWSGPPER